MDENRILDTGAPAPMLPNMSARAYLVKDPKQEKGSILAYASVELGGCFAVTGIKIVEGKDGPFVAMPSHFGKDKQHRDICFPTTAVMREALNAVVMDAYREALEHQATRAAQAVERLAERSGKPSLRDALHSAMKDVAARPPQEAQRAMSQGAR